MKRPLLIVAITYIIGIIIGVYLNKSIPLIFLILIYINLINIKNIRNKIDTKTFRKIKSKLLNTLVITITLIISIINIKYLNNKYKKIYELDEKEIEVIGTICEEIKETKYKYTITIKLEGKYKNVKLILNIKKGKGKDNNFKYGNKIKVKGIYNKPVGRRNYKGFNYEEYLKTKGIYGNVNVSKEIKVLKKRNLNIILIIINNISNKMKINLRKILPVEIAGLATGILLGDSSKLDDNIKEKFKDCNLSHMLAVSGAHLSYLIIGSKLLLNKNIFGIKKSNILCIIVVIIFMIITNMTPSVVRAGIMVIISIIASLIYRKQDTFETMSIALLYTLFKNPFSLFNIGLQLSYLATLSIIIFYPILKKVKIKENIKILEKIKINNVLFTNSTKLNKVKEYFLENMLVSISANILILPLIIYNFNTIPTNFIISNLIVGPLLGFAILIGFLVIIVSCVSIKIAKPIGLILNILLNLILKITKVISKISNILVITPKLFTIIFVYGVIICFLIYIFNKKKVEGKVKKIIKKYYEKYNNKYGKNKRKILVIILTIVLISNAIIIIPKEKDLRVYFIDVGQGDSSLIKTPKGKNILIDGGGDYNIGNKSVGEKILLPYLLDRRIKKLDYIIISHFDIDHVGGVLTIMEKLKVKNVIIGKQFEESNNYNKFIRIANKKNIKVHVAKLGEKINIEKDLFFDILWPKNKDGILENRLNNNSLVCKLIYNKNSILFTGDIEKLAEEEIVDLYKNTNKLKSSILKVPHHGSKTSSTKEFLKLIKPKISLIGVGKDNKFGHPDNNTLIKLEELKCKIYRTDILGEIEVNINKNGKIKINTM